MLYIGIDPGAHGGIAVLPQIGDPTSPLVFPMPLDDDGKPSAPGLSGLIGRIILTDEVVIACERVNAMPKQGVVSMFNFGMGFGIIKGCVAAMGIPLLLVTPQSWKRLVLADRYEHDKEGMIGYAKSVWPDLNLVLPRCRKPHDGMADALGIAEWARQTQSSKA
jgi:crossover junction endodeoxyribonuclease RuvC